MEMIKNKILIEHRGLIFLTTEQTVNAFLPCISTEMFYVKRMAMCL